MAKREPMKGYYPITNLPPELKKKLDEHLARKIDECAKTMENVEPTYAWTYKLLHGRLCEVKKDGR